MRKAALLCYESRRVKVKSLVPQPKTKADGQGVISIDPEVGEGAASVHCQNFHLTIEASTTSASLGAVCCCIEGAI